MGFVEKRPALIAKLKHGPIVTDPKTSTKSAEIE